MPPVCLLLEEHFKDGLNGLGKMPGWPLGNVPAKLIMKKILILAIILCATLAKAQWDFTYSTNLFYALTYPTNVYIGTNGTDTNVDTFHFWATKINAAHTLFWTHLQTDEATITNQGFRSAQTAEPLQTCKPTFGR